MTAHVLDASASVELLLETVAGAALEAKLPASAQWWVPEHYFVEVPAALRRIEAQGLVDPARATAAVNRFLAGRVTRVQIRPLLGDAWARRGHLTMADALYVVLAEHLDATLVTADDKLARSPGLTVTTITASRD